MSLTSEDFGFQPIENKVVLLTGASSGMGRAAALLPRFLLNEDGSRAF